MDERVQTIFQAWVEATGRSGRTVLDPSRRRLIQRALYWGYDVVDLLEAVEGITHSEFHMGDNRHGRVYDSLEIVLRDAEHIERFRDLTRSFHSTQTAAEEARAILRDL